MQPQPIGVKIYIRFMIIAVPTLLALGSFCIKCRFPLRTKTQSHQIGEGIGRKHNPPAKLSRAPIFPPAAAAAAAAAALRCCRALTFPAARVEL